MIIKFPYKEADIVRLRNRGLDKRSPLYPESSWQLYCAWEYDPHKFVDDRYPYGANYAAFCALKYARQTIEMDAISEGRDWAGLVCAVFNASREELELLMPPDADARIRELALRGIS